MKQVNHLYILTAFALLLTSLFSIGFLHPDEQYYTLDFAFHELGILEHLQTWELDSKIRPWTLPYLYVVILAPFKFLGIENPFTLATIARLFSAFVSFFTIIRFTTVFRGFLSKENGKLFTKFSLLFWPLVFMGVRTSSDNISTCILILGITTIVQNYSRKNLLLGGLLLGLAFSLRHQTGVMSLAFGLWILLNKKVEAGSWFKYFSSTILIGVLAGIGLDGLGYSNFTLTPLNYLTENLIKDKISTFGVSPWWGYFQLVIKQLNIFGVLLVGTTAIYIRRFPKSLESTLFLSFFIFHCLIGHKELRFIYPLLFISTFMLFKVIDFNRHKKSFNSLFTLSLIGTLIVCFKPAYTPMKFYEFLYSFKKGEPLTVHTFKDRKGSYPRLEMDVYKRDKLTIVQELDSSSSRFYTFTTKYSDLEMLSSKYSCETEYLSYPKWVLKFNFFKWRDRSNIWALSSCSK